MDVAGLLSDVSASLYAAEPCGYWTPHNVSGQAWLRPITGYGTRHPSQECRGWGNMTRNEMGVIVSVAESLVDLLGWRPEQLIGCKSHQFVHPEDQASAIAAWVSMVTTPGTAGYWRGRYQTAEGNWQWVETTNRLENLDLPVVYTSMIGVTVAEVSIEEELRARTQMLSRLSDALPVGLFEIDTARRIKFTNDRLHLIVGLPPAATIGAQLMNLADEDQLSLEVALSAVLADQLVDDIEIRIHDASRSSHRICLLSLRALTDGAGSVSGAIGLLSDVTDRVQLRSELEIRASVDQLTSCLNRAAILERLGTALTQDDSASRGTAVVYIDLDRFKPVNDLIGHAAGDRLLAESLTASGSQRAIGTTLAEWAATSSWWFVQESKTRREPSRSANESRLFSTARSMSARTRST